MKFLAGCFMVIVGGFALLMVLGAIGMVMQTPEERKANEQKAEQIVKQEEAKEAAEKVAEEKAAKAQKKAEEEAAKAEKKAEEKAAKAEKKAEEKATKAENENSLVNKPFKYWKSTSKEERMWTAAAMTYNLFKEKTQDKRLLATAAQQLFDCLDAMETDTIKETPVIDVAVLCGMGLGWANEE